MTTEKFGEGQRNSIVLVEDFPLEEKKTRIGLIYEDRIILNST